MSIVSNAGVFANSIPDIILFSPSYRVNSGQTVSVHYEAKQTISMPSSLVAGKKYSFYVNFNYAHSFLGGGVFNPSYRFFVLIGGEKYYFSQEHWLYFTAGEVTTDYFTFGVECDALFSSDMTSNFKYLYEDYGEIKYYYSVGRIQHDITNFSWQIEQLPDEDSRVVQKIQDGNELQQQGNNLQQQENNLQQEQNFLQQEQNNLQAEENETSKNIFEKISDFFAGFFDGIINAFKSLFIPDDDYFADYFTRLNDYFASKLGMLYTPIDMFVTLLTSVNNANASDVGIPFPGLKWEDTYIIEPQTISLSTISSDYPELQEKLYFVTNIIMIGSVLWLLQVKLREVLTE